MSNVVFLTLLCCMLVGTECAVSVPLWVIELGKQTSCLLWLPFQAWESGCAAVPVLVVANTFAPSMWEWISHTQMWPSVLLCKHTFEWRPERTAESEREQEVMSRVFFKLSIGRQWHNPNQSYILNQQDLKMMFRIPRGVTLTCAVLRRHYLW